MIKPRDQSRFSGMRWAIPGNLSITKLAVALDYDAVDALGVRFKDTVNLEVRRARRWEVWQWFWNQPDRVQPSIKLGNGWRCVGSHVGFLIMQSAIPLGINQ